MSSEAYRFKVGTFECAAVSDGVFTYAPPTFPPPAKFLFANASKEPLKRVLREHSLQPEQWKEWISPYICVAVNTGKHMVLVDTGAGNLGPDTGKLLMNLQVEGIAPRDIDTVILTHGHPDHIGGNTIKGKPAFPTARFVMWKDEWDFWTSELTELKADEHVNEVLLEVARNNLPPIEDQLYLVDHETEIVPGISAVAAPGHTPGHMALTISSEGEQLLCIADAALHPVHLERPDWHAVVDFSPELLLDTRRRLFSKAEEGRALVLAFHFPFPGLGHIIRKGEQWRWQPVKNGLRKSPVSFGFSSTSE